MRVYFRRRVLYLGSPPSLRVACTLILVLFFFFVLGWGFSVLRISFWLLSFGILSDLQLEDSDLSEFLNDVSQVLVTKEVNIVHPSLDWPAISFLGEVRFRGGEILFSWSKYLVRYWSSLMATSANTIIAGFPQVVLKVL